MERYWVGDRDGDWDDVRNWSKTVGGEGGASIPQCGDDAFFDRSVSVDGVPYDYTLWPTFHAGDFWVMVEFRCGRDGQDNYIVTGIEKEVLPVDWIEKIHEEGQVLVASNCAALFRVKTRNDFGDTTSRNDLQSVFYGGWAEYVPFAALSVRSAGGLSLRAEIVGSLGETAELSWGDGAVDVIRLGVGRRGEDFEAWHITDEGYIPVEHSNLLIHDYTEPGQKNISLRVENVEAEADYTSTTFIVRGEMSGNEPPSALDLEIRREDYRATATWFAGNTLFFVVDWGDGGKPEFLFDIFTASHVYSKSGVYTVGVTAYNASGLTEAYETISFETPQSDSATTYTRCSRLALLKTSLAQGGMA